VRGITLGRRPIARRTLYLKLPPGGLKKELKRDDRGLRRPHKSGRKSSRRKPEKSRRKSSSKEAKEFPRTYYICLVSPSTPPRRGGEGRLRKEVDTVGGRKARSEGTQTSPALLPRASQRAIVEKRGGETKERGTGPGPRRAKPPRMK